MKSTKSNEVQPRLRDMMKQLDDLVAKVQDDNVDIDELELICIEGQILSKAIQKRLESSSAKIITMKSI